MKRILAVAVCMLFLVTACDNGGKYINGKFYDTYGFIDRDSNKQECVKYRLVKGNIVLSIVFSEALLVPIWLLGFDIYEPTGADFNCLRDLDSRSTREENRDTIEQRSR